MSPDDLDAIEARADAVVEGPWEAVNDYSWGVRDPNGMWVVCSPEPLRYDILNADEARFIANARTDIPALIAEVRRLRDVCSYALGECSEAFNSYTFEKTCDRVVTAMDAALAGDAERVTCLLNSAP